MRPGGDRDRRVKFRRKRRFWRPVFRDRYQPTDHRLAFRGLLRIGKKLRRGRNVHAVQKIGAGGNALIEAGVKAFKGAMPDFPLRRRRLPAERIVVHALHLIGDTLESPCRHLRTRQRVIDKLEFLECGARTNLFCRGARELSRILYKPLEISNAVIEVRKAATTVL
jgi:hypothetical protein